MLQQTVKTGFVLLFLVCSFQPSGNTGSPYAEAVKLYNNADRLFNLDDPTEATDSIALQKFRQVITRLEKLKIYDTLLFQSYLKEGILLDVTSRFTDAKNAYLQAAVVQSKSSQVSDSLLFRVFVYTGTAYYNLNDFDSSNYYLLQAEKVLKRFPHLTEKDRLYNALGALYYENGNYLQSKNYFMQALQAVQEEKKGDDFSALNFENNIAATLYRLGLYKEALSMYRKLLTYKVYESHTYLNIGRAYIELQQYPQALAALRKVNQTELPCVLNEIAKTFLEENRYDSALFYLDHFNRLQEQTISTANRIDEGVNHLRRADVLIAQQQTAAALPFLQQAIIEFSGNFTNADIFSNPEGFIGSFASYKLFEALFKKAKVFNRLYAATQQENYLQAAYTTGQSAIGLFRYIEKSFDTDDAKIFLKQNSHPVYSEVLGICLAMHRLYPKQDYLEQAFIVVEKSKASVIAAKVTENALRKVNGVDPALLQKERNIKYNIARLNIKSDQVQDSLQLNAIALEKARFETELSGIHQTIEQNSDYYRVKYEEKHPGVKEIRQQLKKQQALISFYVAEDQLHGFIITGSSFSHVRFDSFPLIKKNIQHWITALSQTQSGRKFREQATADALYRQLVKPLQAYTGTTEEWILVPDDILYYLPFESLPAGTAGKTLLETTTTSYLFSSRLLLASAAASSSYASYSVVSFAPFARQSLPFHYPGFTMLNRLPASLNEIKDVKGLQFIDSLATKQQFLQQLNRFPVIHLATHAVADLENSKGSFIAFYPQTHNPAEDELYLEELYGLNMEGTELVIISACETGNGRLVNSEGVISLSRAFTYAGCASVVSSLWKADDAATAAILKRFHDYLKKGYTKAKALQQAKVDYINSDAVNKTPNFWAHLVITGSTAPVVKKKGIVFWGSIVLACITATGTWVVIRRRKKKEKVDGFS